MLKACRDVAVTSLADQERILPFAMIVSDDNHMYLPATGPWEGSASDEAKDYFVGLVRASCLVYRASMVGFVSEAWTVDVTDGEKLNHWKAWRKENPDASFSEYERRKEVATIQLESERGRANAFISIHRAPGTQSPYVDEVEDDAEVGWAGYGTEDWLANLKSRMTNLYLPRAIQDRADVVDKARKHLERNGVLAVKIDPDEENLKRKTPRPMAN